MKSEKIRKSGRRKECKGGGTMIIIVIVIIIIKIIIMIIIIMITNVSIGRTKHEVRYTKT